MSTITAEAFVAGLMAADHRRTASRTRARRWRLANLILMQCLLYPVMITIALSGPRDMTFDPPDLTPHPAPSHILRPGIDPGSHL